MVSPKPAPPVKKVEEVKPVKDSDFKLTPKKPREKKDFVLGEHLTHRPFKDLKHLLKK